MATVNPVVDEPPGVAHSVDPESAEWLGALADRGAQREAALARLHEMLLRIAQRECRRRGPRLRITGPELEDLAYQAAADALVAITRKLGQFRGESRFTTWAYKFVILEVSDKIGRHFWRNPGVPLDAEDWDKLPDRFGFEPAREAEWRDLLAALRRAVDTELSPRQRQVFVAIVVNAVPLDALAIELSSNRNAIYKMMFDARRKLRAALAANGYMDHDTAGALMNGYSELDCFLRTDPRDVGCAQATEMLHVYAELVAAGEPAEERYPGIAAHLQACGPCGGDFDGLLDALRDETG
jgi:RNA polymerase sigma-70 factor (ECF subfamily)